MDSVSKYTVDFTSRVKETATINEVIRHTFYPTNVNSVEPPVKNLWYIYF